MQQLVLVLDAAMVSASSGQPGGFRNASASSPARSSTALTVPTWTGSPLCEAAITAASRSGRGSSTAVSETAACSGFIHERAKIMRSGSPADAMTIRRRRTRRRARCGSTL